VVSYWVYILASKPRGTLYIGVTNDLVRRVSEHRSGDVPGFTKDYNVKMLVYFEEHADIERAIEREKKLKRWARAWKVDLIWAKNPEWDDLFDDIAK
jgi:putative endonuclease